MNDRAVDALLTTLRNELINGDISDARGARTTILKVITDIVTLNAQPRAEDVAEPVNKLRGTDFVIRTAVPARYTREEGYEYSIFFLDGRLTTSKIDAIRYARERSGGSLGLKDAKDYVEKLPVVAVEHGGGFGFAPGTKLTPAEESMARVGAVLFGK